MAIPMTLGRQDLEMSPFVGNGSYHPATPYAAPVYQAPTAAHPPGLPPLPPTLGGGSTGGGSTGGTPAPATPPPAALPAPAPQVPAISPENALSNFANSAGMKFAMQQMANGVNNLYAAHGELQSGAAAKEIQDRAGQMAIQNYFMPYMQMVQAQQAMGAQAASSIAGVGSNFGNTVAGMGQNFANSATGINQNMGNALSSGALNIGNANANQAIIGGLANAGIGSAIGSGLGQIGSSFFAPSSPGFDVNSFNNTVAQNNAALGM